jgi:acyl-CoA thioesterase-1
MRLINSVVVGAVGLGALACGKSGENPKAAATVPLESTTVAGASRGAAAPTTTARPRVLFLGTSLTAGYGVDPDSAYPAVLQRLANEAGLTVDVINGGLSGETSAGALRRADWLLSQRVAVLVIETGANDGLRGLEPDSTAANIVALIARARSRQPGAAIVLCQMEAPRNLGPDYTRRFHAVFGRVAKQEGVRLLPFLLDGVAGKPELNQDDGIHPTPEGARRVAATVFRALRPVLDSLVR